ncbi:MAG: acyltransferase domain-containing protein [Legionella sp.]|nr:acyltransferase domain-containing protein [Legionella sp.]
MPKPIVFMFSGQGSHYYQMGRELFEQLPLFKYWLIEADTIYKDITGLSILKVLYDEGHKKSSPFTRTLFTHPAIYMVQYALGQLLIEQGIRPDYTLGTSLGEFTAAVFAGILTFETALIAIIKQAQIIEERCGTGSMLAILASPELYYSNPFIQATTELAALNFDSHFIVSGSDLNLTALERYLASQNINYQRLAVSHGFHSSLIDAAASDYQYFISQLSLHVSSTPFISCAYPEQVKMSSPIHFWNCIRLPIQFKATLEHLEKNDDYYYLDVGPSGTLATFVQYNLKNSSSQSFRLITPYGDEANNCMKIIEYFTAC